MSVTKTEVRTDEAPYWPNAPMSQGLVVGSLVFVGGQGPRDPETLKVPKGIEAQSHKVLRSVTAILEAAGSNLDEVVKVTIHLADINDRPKFNDVYMQYFKPPYPTRTAVGSTMSEGTLVEVDIIAVKQTREGL